MSDADARAVVARHGFDLAELTPDETDAAPRWEADDCPICIERIPSECGEQSHMVRLTCCGKAMCKSCSAEFTNRGAELLERQLCALWRRDLSGPVLQHR